MRNGDFGRSAGSWSGHDDPEASGLGGSGSPVSSVPPFRRSYGSTSRIGPPHAGGVCRRRGRLAKVLEKTHLNGANFLSVTFPGNPLAFGTMHMNPFFFSMSN